jgi:transcriptional regulatory protein LevR
MLLEEETEKKLQVLYQVGKIKDNELAFVHRVDSALAQRFSNPKIADEMLLIHLSMAMERTRQDNPIDAMPPDFLNDLVSQEKYPDAVAIWNQLKAESPVQLPESEVNYVLMHITTILGRN